MHAFDVMGDPVRRRILELLAAQADASPVGAGEIAATIGAEFNISQPAVSQRLKVLREAGFATVTVAGSRRLYAVEAAPFREIDAWLDRYGRFWAQRLDALDTEVRRGRRTRSAQTETVSSPPITEEKP